MKTKNYKNMSDFALGLGLPSERGIVAEVKALLTYEIIKTVEKEKLTHQKIAELSKIPRSAITGIINGSLQKVSIDRLIRIISVLGKTIKVEVKKVA